MPSHTSSARADSGLETGSAQRYNALYAMDVDSSSSSPSERLSVVCSASAEYSSNSSEYSPNSRRNSMNESVVKDEQYWERRRKNNDASKRSREKRRISDMAMEQRILALSQENHLLKSRLESRTAAESLLQTARPDFASLPSQSNTVLPSTSKARPRGLSESHPTPLKSPLSVAVHAPAADVFSRFAIADGSTAVDAALHGPQSVTATGPIAVQYVATSDHAALSTASRHSTAGSSRRARAENRRRTYREKPYRATPSPSVFSIGSAFQPFQAHKESVIMKAERISPDSSSDRVERVIQRGSVVIKCVDTHLSPSKSDCESISSSASLSPSHSSEDHPESSAIRRALDGNSSDDKKEQYMDRRRRNNEAAKRCRANRRAVFEYRSRRVQLLESENDQLKEEIAKLKREVDQFKSLLTAQNIMDTTQ
ncbi:basic region leucine zipper [Ancylostoma ceylanicum]|uniref:Basic region leucine zipper n=2 Tax=Ancylostoma ceylanicum TaxID=53326 RepID=A0A0D6LPV4_9BILA|nr:basic region leucine zipper [Ancylostoma ceylanicum]